MTTDTQVEQNLIEAFGAPMTSVERGKLDARVAALLEGPHTPRRQFRLRLTRGLLVAAAVTLLIPALVAGGAAILSSEAPRGMSDAAAYDAEVAAAKAVTPIPPGATWPPHLDAAPDRAGSYAVGLGRSMVEFNAYCLWLADWYDANRSGSAARAGAAIATLGRVPSWESFSGPLADGSFRDHVGGVVRAADRGDATSVLQELELNCRGTWPAGAAANGARYMCHAHLHVRDC